MTVAQPKQSFIAAVHGSQYQLIAELLVSSEQTEIKQWQHAVLGLALLSGQLKVQQCADFDKELLGDFQHANQALLAYSAGDSVQQIQACLKNLSTQSAFKDFDLLMTALLITGNGQACTDQLSEIEDDSPYQSLAECICTALFNPAVDAGDVESSAEQFLLVLLKRQSRALNLIDEHLVSSAQLMDWLLANQRLFDQQSSRNIAAQLVIEDIDNLDSFQQHFPSLDDFELRRLQALNAEQEGLFAEAHQHWEACVVLAEQSINDDALAASLRLLKQRSQQCAENANASGFPANESDSDELNAEYYLGLIEQYHLAEDEAALQSTLKQALEQFPQHPEMIAAALQYATQTADYQQAAQLAEQLLKSDRLNKAARQLLITAHLAYADRLALRGQRYQANQILDQVETLERSSPSALVLLHRAVQQTIAGLEDEAEQLVEQACQQKNCYLSPYLHMAVLTSSLGLKARYSKHYLSLIKSLNGYRASADEMLECIQLLDAQRSNARIEPLSLLAVIRMHLLNSLDTVYTTEQRRMLCQLLESFPAYEDLQQAAQSGCEIASQHVLETTEFEFYRIIGLTRADPALLNTDDANLLEASLELLQDGSNPQLRERIVEYLQSNRLQMGGLQQSAAFEQHTDMSFGQMKTLLKGLFGK